MKPVRYSTIKCLLHQFCKNDYLKSKINEVVLNVNKIIYEGYILANLHIICLLQEDKQIKTASMKGKSIFRQRVVRIQVSSEAL